MVSVVLRQYGEYRMLCGDRPKVRRGRIFARLFAYLRSHSLVRQYKGRRCF